jgi:hypothetical protein
VHRASCIVHRAVDQSQRISKFEGSIGLSLSNRQANTPPDCSSAGPAITTKLNAFLDDG